MAAGDKVTSPIPTTLYNPQTRQYETVEIGSPRYDELRQMAQTYDALPREERLSQSISSTGIDSTMEDGMVRMTDPVTGEVNLVAPDIAYQIALAMTGELQNPLGMPGMDTIINMYADREGNNASPWGGGTSMPYWYQNPDGSPGPLTVDENGRGSLPTVGSGVPAGSNPYVPQPNPIGGGVTLDPGEVINYNGTRPPLTSVNRSWSNVGPSGAQPIQPNDSGGNVSPSTRQALAMALTRNWGN